MRVVRPSAASAANAAIDHMHDWALGTPDADWVSMSYLSDGSYGAPDGIVTSFPTTCADGDFAMVTGLEVNEFSQSRMQATWGELSEERDTVSDLGLI